MIITTLGGILALILTGQGLNRLGWLTKSSWAEIDRLVYWLLFPALLVRALAHAPAPGAETLRLTLVLLTSQCVMGAVLWLSFRLWPSPAAFTSGLQGSLRFNTFVIYGVVHGVLGASGVALLAPALAMMIICANIWSVEALRRFGTSATSPRPLWHELQRNPLILACALGLLLNLLGLRPFGIVDVWLQTLGQTGLGLSLLSVGAGLMLNGLGRGGWGAVALTCLLKLMVGPALYGMLAGWAGLSGAIQTVGLVAMAAPTASMAYILARQMGGDAPLMAAIIATQTLAAIFTLGLWLSLS